jgi:hypothetical protein
MSMGFKKTTRNLDFADLAMANCLEQNRSIKLTLLNVSIVLQSASGQLPIRSVNFSLGMLTNLTGRVQQLNTINLELVEFILLSNYTVGTSEEGACATGL